MKKQAASKSTENRTLAGLFQDRPHLSPTMKARQMHEKLGGDAYEEKYLQELISLADEETVSPAASDESSLANDETTTPKEGSLDVLEPLSSKNLQRKASR